MSPITPTLMVRVLQPEEISDALVLVNPLLVQAPYSAPLDEAAARQQWFDDTPPTLYSVRWQRRQVLGAWRAGQLVGFIDVATGLDRDSVTEPDYRTLGLLRFLVLPERQELTGETARALLQAAEQFWRAGGVGYVKAFHISTGYPQFQAGAGCLPADWLGHVQVLTARDYLLQDRYYCFYRDLDTPLLEETVPQTAISLALRGTAEDRQYLIFFRRTELIAEARLVWRPAQPAERRGGIAYIARWHVDDRWRNQKMGRWLLRRMINDVTQRGLWRLVVHVHAQHAAAMNLLAQHGFVEHNYRGYGLEKTLQE
jgi:GNAT superfamily N-acetyltransferase